MLRLMVIAVALAAPSAASAHTGVHDLLGLSSGFLHPVSGLDHVLAMVAVGLLAAQIGGRALWLVPLAFLVMMIAGGTLGMAGVSVPYVEIGVAASVLVLGLAVGLRQAPPTVAATALVGFFALFHGHAHGAEMPETASSIGYGAGFVLATLLLHAAGLGLGFAAGLSGPSTAHRATRFAGGAISVAGAALIAGAL